MSHAGFAPLEYRVVGWRCLGSRPPVSALGFLPFRHVSSMRLPPREGGPIRLSGWTVYIACHGEAASPGAGRAVYPTLLEISFIWCPAWLGPCDLGRNGPWSCFSSRRSSFLVGVKPKLSIKDSNRKPSRIAGYRSIRSPTYYLPQRSSFGLCCVHQQS